jgi:tetratricopeptide (TPR) repeat protein
MARVFLSYDRDDASRAKPLAMALERAGHAVWWDFHIKGGAQYSKAIDEALKAADAVVVLWSRSSVESAWVRDEAAAGRDSGRLIPIQIDGTETPLGFRQFQNLDFSRWKGRSRSSEFRQLMSAIDDLAGASASEPARVPGDRRRFSVSQRPLLVGLVIMALAIGAFAAVRFFVARTSVPTLAVAASEPSPSSHALARDLFVNLGRLQAANPNALEIVADPEGKSADYTFQVSASHAADKTAGSIALLSRDRTLLWSKDFERPADQYADLKQQLVLTAARVLSCATAAVTGGGSKLDQRTLKLYLNGCASLSEIAGHDFRELVPVFREVTRRAPRFEDGWAKLVITEAAVIGWESIPKNSPEGRNLAEDIAAARKLNPAMPEAYGAEFIMAGEDDLAKSAEILERAARANPDDPKILSMRVGFLRRVGRMKEAVDDAKRAAEHDPLDPGLTTDYIEALTYAGKADTALQEIKKAEKLWPGTRIVTDEASFRFYLRYGDPKEALRIIRTDTPENAHFESFLMARIEPTKENVDRAIADAKSEVSQSPRGIGWLVLALAEFGRDEAIYPIVETPRGISILYLSDAFFRPTFHRFRQNPRFMRIANNLGLIDYWRKTGKWPDFCFEPDLPYNCKAEAAKLAA